MTTLHGYLSPLHPVNLVPEARAAANIPCAAAHFAWCYPFLSDWGLDSACELTDPDILFATVGGYVYLDSDFRVVHMNAVLHNPSGGLRFGPQKVWRPEWTMQLDNQR